MMNQIRHLGGADRAELSHPEKSYGRTIAREP
jgi:hypothetical protein